MILVAHDIRSLHNVGAILRTAAAFGVEHVYLTGITGVPPRKEIAKVSLGAEDIVPWSTGVIEHVVADLRNRGYMVVGLENARGSVAIDEFVSNHQGQIALVLGNEVDGIDANVRAMLDALVEIPMHAKRSLNVSVACGVAVYALLKF